MGAAEGRFSLDHLKLLVTGAVKTQDLGPGSPTSQAQPCISSSLIKSASDCEEERKEIPCGHTREKSK